MSNVTQGLNSTVPDNYNSDLKLKANEVILFFELKYDYTKDKLMNICCCCCCYSLFVWFVVVLLLFLLFGLSSGVFVFKFSVALRPQNHKAY